MTDKKELKEEDIRNVNGGFRVIDPSEDKELKEEDLNKISGGLYDTMFYCNKCQKVFGGYYNTTKCSECGSEDIREHNFG